MSARPSGFALLMAAALWTLCHAPAAIAAGPDPDVEALSQRLQAIDTDPQRNAFAAYERLQARQAVQALALARKKQRPQILDIAKIRVETAEIASATEAGRIELQQLDTQRGELLMEASRRDADRARAEAERMRVEAQIQAEETARLRQEIEAETRGRTEAEGLLDTVAGAEAEKLRQAKAREAELARQEAALLAGGKPAPAGGAHGKPKPKPKAKPAPKPVPRPVRSGR